MEAALQPSQAAQCAGVQTYGARDLVTGKARSGFRYMGATAVSVLPSSGERSNLRRGIVRGGRSKTLAGSIGIDLELRNRLQGHAMTDVGSVHYDRWGYLPEKRKAMETWSEWLNMTIE